MRARLLLTVMAALPLLACTPKPSAEQTAAGVAAFATVQKVFQHPRCQNCHIPGDSPLQFDAGHDYIDRMTAIVHPLAPLPAGAH